MGRRERGLRPRRCCDRRHRKRPAFWTLSNAGRALEPGYRSNGCRSNISRPVLLPQTSSPVRNRTDTLHTGPYPWRDDLVTISGCHSEVPGTPTPDSACTLSRIRLSPIAKAHLVRYSTDILFARRTFAVVVADPTDHAR